MKLTSAESDFWQRVYAAAVTHGCSHVQKTWADGSPMQHQTTPAEMADQAVVEWRVRTQDDAGYR
jgi:hypothetical protein